MAIIAIDLGGTKIAAALFHEDGSVKIKEQVFLSGAGGKDAGALVAGAVRSLKSANPQETIKAVGICVPGIVYSKKETVVSFYMIFGGKKC